VKPQAKERAQLEKYGVFTKVPQIPEGVKLSPQHNYFSAKVDKRLGPRTVDTKWVYVIKRKTNGTIEKYKARKVGRRFTQEAR